MIHSPGMVEQINRETVPVWLNYSLNGFPRDLKAFEYHHRDTLPWFRLNSAHFILMDRDGSRLFGGGFEVIVDRTLHRSKFPFGPSNDDDTFPRWQLEEGIARYREYHRLQQAAAEDPSKQGEFEEYCWRLDAWRDAAYLPNVEPRVWTALIICDFVGPNPWRLFSERFRHPEPGTAETLAPGVRNASLHAFAKVAAEVKPLIPIGQEVINSYYKIWRDSNPGDPAIAAAEKFAAAHDDGSPFAYAIRYRAAKGAELTAGVKLFSGDEHEDVVAVFKQWWAQAESRYAIEESTDPALRFVFYRQPFSDAGAVPTSTAK